MRQQKRRRSRSKERAYWTRIIIGTRSKHYVLKVHNELSEVEYNRLRDTVEEHMRAMASSPFSVLTLGPDMELERIG